MFKVPKPTVYSVDCVLTVYESTVDPITLIENLIAQMRSDAVNNRYPWKCMTRSNLSMEEYTEDAWAFTLDFQVDQKNAESLIDYVEDTFAKVTVNQEEVYLDVQDVYLSLDSSRKSRLDRSFV